MTPDSSAQNSGLLIVISGPSGVGKTTIVHALIERFHATFSISMTTRQKTKKDVEGRDYFFVTPARFRQAIKDAELLEWAEVFGNFYGTPRIPVEQALAEGKHVILEIDVNGGIQVRRNFPKAMMIFILPPSEQELLNRLRSRAREDEQTIQRRFREAQHEIRQARDSGAYNHFVINHTLDKAIEEVVSIVAEATE